MWHSDFTLLTEDPPHRLWVSTDVGPMYEYASVFTDRVDACHEMAQQFRLLRDVLSVFPDVCMSGTSTHISGFYAALVKYGAAVVAMSAPLGETARPSDPQQRRQQVAMSKPDSA